MNEVKGQDSIYWGWDATMFIERIRELEAELAGFPRPLHETMQALKRMKARAEKAEARVAELAPEMWTFFREMTRKFRLHDEDRGDSWKQTGWPWVTRLREELEEAVAVDALPDEWADVANYAFFAWWHCFPWKDEAREREAE